MSAFAEASNEPECLAYHAKESLEKSSLSSPSSSPSIRQSRLCLPKCLMLSGRSKTTKFSFKRPKNEHSKSKGPIVAKSAPGDRKANHALDNGNFTDNPSTKIITDKITADDENKNDKDVLNKSNKNSNKSNFANLTLSIKHGGSQLKDASPNNPVIETSKLLDNLELFESMPESTV